MGLLFLWIPVGLFDRGLELLSRLENRNLLGRDLDLLAGLRISPRARRSLPNVECSEPHQGHALALLQGFGDRPQHCIHASPRVSLGASTPLGHRFNQISLVHSFPPFPL